MCDGYGEQGTDQVECRLIRPVDIFDHEDGRRGIV